MDRWFGQAFMAFVIAVLSTAVIERGIDKWVITFAECELERGDG